MKEVASRLQHGKYGNYNLNTFPTKNNGLSSDEVFFSPKPDFFNINNGLYDTFDPFF